MEVVLDGAMDLGFGLWDASFQVGLLSGITTDVTRYGWELLNDKATVQLVFQVRDWMVPI